MFWTMRSQDTEPIQIKDGPPEDNEVAGTRWKAEQDTVTLLIQIQGFTCPTFM
jgi:hypothetical protein